eukprot:907165-Amphidinium_carterae.1
MDSTVLSLYPRFFCSLVRPFGRTQVRSLILDTSLLDMSKPYLSFLPCLKDNRAPVGIQRWHLNEDIPELADVLDKVNHQLAGQHPGKTTHEHSTSRPFKILFRVCASGNPLTPTRTEDVMRPSAAWLQAQKSPLCVTKR